MYVFVRITGVVLLIFGIMFMLVGLGGALYSLVQNDTVVSLVNTYILANTNSVMPQQDIRFYTTAYGVALFVFGMITAAFGQLMLVFVDLALNTRETNILLRSLRRRGAVANAGPAGDSAGFSMAAVAGVRRTE